MNIIVRSLRGDFFVRPDTSWERKSGDFYPPDFVSALDFTPVIFACICKPGRSIPENFACRYFDRVGFGALFYPSDMLDGSAVSIARASCLDHSSYLPHPMASVPAGGDLSRRGYSMRVNGREVFNGEGVSRTDIGKAISESSGIIYLRYGDVIAIELADPVRIVSRENRLENEISLTFDGAPDCSFRVLF